MNDKSEVGGDVSIAEQLNLETARIRWQELQRYFALGVVMCVSQPLDLLKTAELIALDDAEKIKDYLDEGLLQAVSDAQALAWFEADADVWAVVIKPWVLVQSE